MKFSALKQTIIEQFMAPKGNMVVPFIEGRPGGGKSACAREIADHLCEVFNIKPEQVVEFNPSLRDPVDIMGIPFKSVDGKHSEWLPPAEFYNLRQGVGPCVLIIEELSDAQLTMQNPMCRVILDRYAGNLQLSDQLFIIATGNRVEDRSGANRMSTKLGNRMRCLEFSEDLGDWVNWAESHNIDNILISFIKFQPNLLSDFDPKRKTNPTPRAWEKVSYIPEFSGDPDGILYMSHVMGDVGEGAAASYIGFRKVYKSLPDFDELLKSPKTYKIPSEQSALFATCQKLATMVTKDTSDADVIAILTYIARTSMEMKAATIRDMVRVPEKKKKLCSRGCLKTFMDISKDLQLVL